MTSDCSPTRSLTATARSSCSTTTAAWGNLRHAWKDGSGWHFEFLEGDSGSVSHYNADVGRFSAPVMQGSVLQLLHDDGSQTNVRHVWSNSTGWHFETLDGDAGSISGYTADVR
jgi:hypothetical protein